MPTRAGRVRGPSPQDTLSRDPSRHSKGREIDRVWLRQSAEDTVPRGGPPVPARRRETMISDSGLA